MTLSIIAPLTSIPLALRFDHPITMMSTNKRCRPRDDGRGGDMTDNEFIPKHLKGNYMVPSVGDQGYGGSLRLGPKGGGITNNRLDTDDSMWGDPKRFMSLNTVTMGANRGESYEDDQIDARQLKSKGRGTDPDPWQSYISLKVSYYYDKSIRVSDPKNTWKSNWVGELSDTDRVGALRPGRGYIAFHEIGDYLVGRARYQAGGSNVVNVQISVSNLDARKSYAFLGVVMNASAALGDVYPLLDHLGTLFVAGTITAMNSGPLTIHAGDTIVMVLEACSVPNGKNGQRKSRGKIKGLTDGKNDKLLLPQTIPLHSGDVTAILASLLLESEAHFSEKIYNAKNPEQTIDQTLQSWEDKLAMKGYSRILPLYFATMLQSLHTVMVWVILNCVSREMQANDKALMITVYNKCMELLRVFYTWLSTECGAYNVNIETPFVDPILSTRMPFDFQRKIDGAADLKEMVPSKATGDMKETGQAWIYLLQVVTLLNKAQGIALHAATEYIRLNTVGKALSEALSFDSFHLLIRTCAK
jgi:hypothetical protein